MKKTLLALIGACAATVGLCGCNGCDDNKEPSRYDSLNAMLDAHFSRVDIIVNETFDEVTLRSEYIIDYISNGATVTYSVERFAPVSFDGEGGLKQTLNGTAVIVDGAVISVNGADANITADIADNGMNFREEYFVNVTDSDKYFSADVKEAGAFLGTQLTCTDMHVLVNFDKNISNIRVTYTSSNGNAVEYLYKFKI